MSDVTTLAAPGDGDDQAQNGRPDQNSAGPQEEPHRRNMGQVLKPEQCLAGLSQLPGLVALGLLKSPQANAMRGAYKDILDHHKLTEQARADRGLADADLLTILRDRPELLGMLEPLLTDEQVAMVMRSAKDGTDEKA